MCTGRPSIGGSEKCTTHTGVRTSTADHLDKADSWMFGILEYIHARRRCNLCKVYTLPSPPPPPLTRIFHRPQLQAKKRSEAQHRAKHRKRLRTHNTKTHRPQSLHDRHHSPSPLHLSLSLKPPAPPFLRWPGRARWYYSVSKQDERGGGGKTKVTGKAKTTTTENKHLWVGVPTAR